MRLVKTTMRMLLITQGPLRAANILVLWVKAAPAARPHREEVLVTWLRAS